MHGEEYDQTVSIKTSSGGIEEIPTDSAYKIRVANVLGAVDAEEAARLTTMILFKTFTAAQQDRQHIYIVETSP